MTLQNLIGSRRTRDRDAAPLGLLALALVGAGVFSLVLLSIDLTRFNGHPSALWPANALVIAALLRSSGRRWPAILITGLCAEFAARLAGGDPTALAAGHAGADALAILVGAGGIRRFVGPSLDLTRMRHLLAFLAFGGLAGPLVGAGMAAGVLGLGGGSAIQTFTGWFAAMALGVLILTPALLVVSVPALRPLFERRNFPRTLGSAGLLLLGLAIVFGQARFPAGFLMMPVLLIITIQLDMVGGALALLITAAVAVFCTLHGMGVASIVAGGMGRQLLMLQLFLLVQTTSILPVAAVRGGRRRVEAQLNTALAEARAATAAALDANRVAELATRIAHLGHWRLDRATDESTWSDEVYAIHGVDPVNHDPADHADLKLYHPEDREAALRLVERAWSTGQGFDMKARLNRASDGAPRIVSYRGEVECGADGEPIALIGVLQDVTEAETARQRVADSEARYRLIADSAKDIIIKGGREGIRYVSESIRRYGYSPEDLVGRPAIELVHPDDHPKVAAIIADLFALGDVDPTRDRTYRMLTAAGGAVWMEGSPSVVRGADGAVTGVITLVRDISDRKAMETALAASEAKYRLIADSAKDVIVELAPDGIHYISEAIRRFGYSPAELIGRSPLDLIHPDDHAKSAALMADLFAHGDVDPARDRTYRVITAAGAAVWVEGSPSVVRDPDGAIVGAVTLLRDITDRKRVETALAESEARYRLMADAASDVLVHYDQTGIRYVSEACRRYGYAPEDLIGKSPASLVHPDDVAKVTALNRELLTNGFVDPTRDRTSRFMTASGEPVWIEGSPSIVRDADGASIGVINLFRDISDRIVAAQAMAESEARYRLLAENSTDVIGCYGADARFTFLSPAIEDVLGYPPGDMVGRLTTEFMHAGDVKRVMKLFAAYLAAGPGAEPIRFEYRARRRDGSEVWLEAHPKAIYDLATGEFVEFQDTVRDVTARKTLEVELRKAMDQAEAATAAKSEFLSNMSHELRTPLTSIIGFAALLHDTPGLPGEAPRYVQRVATASGNLLALVNDILDFSKLEAGQVNLELTPVCPQRLVQELAELFEIQASAKGLSLEVVVEGELPASISVDPTRVRQVMSNLIGNALKFTDQGTITVGLSHEGSQLSVSVTDTGPGVPADRLDRLFKRFSQVDASTTRTHGGTGLGLAICQGLVEAMGGEIGVASRVGEGSAFHFRIPAPVVEAAADLAVGDAEALSLDGLRVLVADDNPANRELARVILEAQGVEVTEAEDGQAAIDLAMGLPYDVILMDIRMPVVDGLEAVERIRAEPGPNQDIPILAFSADGDLERLKGLTEQGFDGVAHKPIVPADLITAICRCLQWDALEQEEGEVLAG